ncbi:hypothetical protein MSNKSG1_08653 [Marinobacter santoriniensis NKSG1]|uniref:Uncharacterized protein n=1 Tax=Marinobacter santoriniensis NKSG1 TaxID=1288826 RepID=M7D5F1_9GAMM|nr:hypothetical protein [Marinobacter santoriniensis]EMP55928.1 hypothetical protein MSNKSG1_08653 [Marinobacter santoriniensis NKSG1]
MRQYAYGCAALAVICLGGAPFAQAELKPISDKAMGEVTGQGFMQVENIPGVDHQFTRMTLGMDVETRVNIDDIQVGQINGGADFSATDVALGHISRDGTAVQYDGNTYAVGDTVPFEAVQPYIELAENPVDGKLSGFRMGFKQARGSVSSVTSSFSGNIGVTLVDGQGGEHAATLFDSATTATNYRATHIGIDDGTADCSTSTNCAPLSHLQSLIVGSDNGDGTTGFTNDFFIGFQREGVNWQSPGGSGTTINAGQGVFINLPSSTKIDMSQLAGPNGVPRLQTHQVDMGTKLF